MTEELKSTDLKATDLKKDEQIKEEVKNVQEKANEIADLDKVQELIKNNEIEFDFENVKYKVKKPTFKQRDDVNKKKTLKQIELLRDETQLLEKDLSALYEKRGIKVSELDKRLKILTSQENDFLMKLGKELEEQANLKDRDTYKDEIVKIRAEKQSILAEKAVLFDSSIESQVQVYSFTYLAYLTLEKFTDEKWQTAFENYESYTNMPEDFVNISVMYASLLTRMGLSQ